MNIYILLLCMCVIMNVEGGGGKKFVSLGKSSEKFSVDIFKNLMVNSTENQFISPMSIQTILGLLQAGSNGKCLEELSKVLHLPKKASLLKDAFIEYMKVINTNNSKIDITTANTIYVAEKYKLPKQYEKLSRAFNAAIQKINSSNPQETVARINKWVENQTHSKIKDIISEDMINTNTILVLVNALYFNGHWKIPFDEDMTHRRVFYSHTTGGNDKMDKIKAEMMIQTGTFNYLNSKLLNAKILELPYEDEAYVMNIILPNDKKGVVSNIDKVFRELGHLEEEEVNVMLPKFQFGYKITLNELLKTMGINSIFEQLEFKGQKSNEDLKVSEIVQKTFIDVNERGSEAAAATAVGIEDRMGGFDKIYFTADHPFIFLIRHKISEAVLFMGTYNTPETPEIPKM